MKLVHWASIFFVLGVVASPRSVFAQQEECTEQGDGTCANPTTGPPKTIKIARNTNEQGKPPEVSLDECNDRHERCAAFQAQGECEKNPGWMIVNCGKSCDACHLRDSKVRCQRSFLNISTEPVYQTGDLDRVMSAIPAKYHDRYNVSVLSTSPWIFTFDNFLTEDETNALINTVEGSWERSTDTGSVNQFGETGRVLSKGRTSSNAWCRHRCESNPHVQNVQRKIEEITEIPKSHYESFQILWYENGQKYNVHHDMSQRQVLLACGPRILTFFLYLSDVEEGGETAFPRLGLSVTPKRGRALLWPSTLNDNMEMMDARTHHEAKPVIKGTKYAANAWIHLYDFEFSNKWGCTGTFD